MRIDRVGDRLIEEGTLRNVGNLYRNAWREDFAGRNRGRGMNNWVTSPLSPDEKIVPGRCRTSLIGSAPHWICERSSKEHRPAWALPSATRHGSAAYRFSRLQVGSGRGRRATPGRWQVASPSSSDPSWRRPMATSSPDPTCRQG
jgi:hypothetical protein